MMQDDTYPFAGYKEVLGRIFRWAGLLSLSR